MKWADFLEKRSVNSVPSVSHKLYYEGSNPAPGSVSSVSYDVNGRPVTTFWSFKERPKSTPNNQTYMSAYKGRKLKDISQDSIRPYNQPPAGSHGIYGNLGNPELQNAIETGANIERERGGTLGKIMAPLATAPDTFVAATGASALAGMYPSALAGAYRLMSPIAKPIAGITGTATGVERGVETGDPIEGLKTGLMNASLAYGFTGGGIVPASLGYGGSTAIGKMQESGDVISALGSGATDSAVMMAGGKALQKFPTIGAAILAALTGRELADQDSNLKDLRGTYEALKEIERLVSAKQQKDKANGASGTYKGEFDKSMLDLRSYSPQALMEDYLDNLYAGKDVNEIVNDLRTVRDPRRNVDFMRRFILPKIEGLSQENIDYLNYVLGNVGPRKF